MNTYRYNKPTKEYQVGYYNGKKKWETIRRFKHELHAIGFVNFLNGGSMVGIEIVKELLETIAKEKHTPVEKLIGKNFEF